MLQKLSSVILKTSKIYRSHLILSSLSSKSSAFFSSPCSSKSSKSSTCDSTKPSTCNSTKPSSCESTKTTTSCGSTKTSPCGSTKTSCTQSANAAIPQKKTEKGTSDFYVEQIFTGCLAEYSYYLDSEGEALVIDPIYDHNIYIEMAAKRGSKIKYIFETHFHADFVSGHMELAKKTGAKIVFGPLAKAEFDFLLAKDGEDFTFGKAQLQVFHTPGHTLESSSFLLKDSKGVPHSIYTGDTLFLNEVGRPDLAANEIIHPEDMAKMLYDSIRNKIMNLPDDVIVFPGHGAGSPCGKRIGAGDFSTIGEQKVSNYAMMKDLIKDDFVKIASSNLPRPLGYMTYDVGLNKGTKKLRQLEDIIKKEKKSFKEFQQLVEKSQKNLVVLDSRNDAPIKGYLKNTLNIPLETTFSIYAGTLIKTDAPIFLIAENNAKTEESIIRLLRVGYDNIVGYLEGGYETWVKNDGGLYDLQTIEADKFKEIYEKDKNTFVLDIRNKTEWEDGVLEGAKLLPLRDLEHEILSGHLDSLKNQKIFMHCRSGPRAIIAFSMLKKNGFNKVANILGGFNRMKELGVKTVNVPFK